MSVVRFGFHSFSYIICFRGVFTRVPGVVNKTAKWGLINAQEIEEAMKKGVDVSAEDVERTRHRRFLYEKHPRIGRLVSFFFFHGLSASTLVLVLPIAFRTRLDLETTSGELEAGHHRSE